MVLMVELCYNLEMLDRVILPALIRPSSIVTLHHTRRMSQSSSSPLAEHVGMELADCATDTGAPDAADAAAAAALTGLSSDVVSTAENLGQ